MPLQKSKIEMGAKIAQISHSSGLILIKGKLNPNPIPNPEHNPLPDQQTKM